MRTEIIYEDRDLLVCYKPAGFPAQTSQVGQMDVESELRNAAAGAPLFIIHRLDQPVEGLLVFAKTKAAAASLSEQSAGGEMKKSYLAVTCGLLPESGTFKDYLLKQSKGNLSRIVPQETLNAKYAELSYEVRATKKIVDINLGKELKCAAPEDVLSLVHISLKTGRHHQIRVQMANAACPLLGDKKYGGQKAVKLSGELGVRNVALCASKLQFVHPSSHENMEFQMRPRGLPFRYFINLEF